MKSLRFLERGKSRKAMKVTKVRRKSSYPMGTTKCMCSDPRAQSDPNGESEPKPRGRPFNSFYFSVLLNFLFQKCRDPNPRPDPNGGSEPEPGLLRRFHLSYQNILLCHFVAEAVSVLGKPIIIYKFNAIRQAYKHLTKYIYKEDIHAFPE